MGKNQKNQHWVLPVSETYGDIQRPLLGKAMEGIKGITEWEWEPNNQRISLHTERPEAIREAITALSRLGIEVLREQKTLPVEGMSCAACSSSVESMLNATKGVLKAVVNLAGHSVRVNWIPGNTDLPQMKKSIRAIGYDLLIEEKDLSEKAIEQARQNKEKTMRRQLIGAAVFAFPVFLLGMFFHNLPYAPYLMWALATPVLFIFGRHFFVNAFRQARHGTANMDTLVALSTGIAYLFSAFNTLFPGVWTSLGLEAHVYFEASSMIVVFILLGKWLEERAKAGTSSAIRKLMGLQPQKVTLVREDGSTHNTDIHLVEVGDVLLVKPGSKIPVDGKLTQGSSFVDESMITGESMPAEKVEGSQVYTGTINQSGSFKMKAAEVGSDTVLARIIQTVQNAQASKAPVQRLVDKVASIFVPVVLTIALATLALWLLIGGTAYLTQALLATVSVLVIACPCALGLATPTAIMVGVGKGAAQGILIKEASSLEKAHRINAMVLDKTGTITYGKPEVTNLKIVTDPWTEQQVKERLFAIESLSGHPLATAILNRISDDDLSTLGSEQFKDHSGFGLTAMIEGNMVTAGNQRLMKNRGILIPTNLQALAHEWEQEAKTVTWMAIDQKITAVMAIADIIKPTSRAAIRELLDHNIEVYMLTGDNEPTAAAVAKATGITQFKAQVLPSEKADFIKTLKQQGKFVAMVGDGINDSEALALADLSIAMGKGSDVAMDVAEITIIASDLSKIPEALKLSVHTIRTIRQNLFWAFFYNVISIPLAAGILYPIWGFLLNPMVASAAMAFSSVSVVSNSLRLRNRKL